MNKKLPVSPCLSETDVRHTREQLLNYFHTTYDEYESLFTLLASDESFYQKPISLRHPLIFYYGHTATFFINKLLLAGLVEERINPEMESMFAIGVDEMSWDDLDETHYDWPPVDAVRAYRVQVRTKVDQIIRTAPLSLPIDWANPFWAVIMGIEHERIHLETSSVLIRQHQLSRVKDSPDWPVCEHSGDAPANYLVPVPAGKVSLGKTYHDPVYGWDNEYGQHKAEIEAFQASAFLVSNREFLDFVEAQGYQTEAYWQQEGWAWREYAQASCPEFWVAADHGWKLRLMTREIPLPMNWPVEVNYHEAKAFCHWKAGQINQPVRLPTEDEWHRIVAHSDYQHLLADNPGDANLHLHHWASSCPVDHFKQGDFYDVAGNVWQWTETPTYPYEGFDVHPLYDDFTTPTFDDQHNLMKGGSWISTGNEALPWSRYAFRRHFFQHAGFRYVAGGEIPQQTVSRYETDKLLSEYAEFHYGDSYFGVANFHQALATLARQVMHGRHTGHALDLGCAVGRASFELAQDFDQVTGIDFSARFIDLANQFRDSGILRYSLIDEGELVVYRERTLAGLGLNETAGCITFLQGDACNLKPHYQGYDLVLAANLIDRLYSPEKLLSSLYQRINPNGILILASPYTWLEEHTKKHEWIGGFKKDGENFTTLDGLKAILGPHFRLLQTPEPIPFVIRETSHKFQHTLSEITVWERKTTQ
ncbi:5-histidylcysteine sulfoxide synthase [Vibrio quintilis]|uniref:Iron(II)-dependent oxidoreductase EgtB n=1 Tax=Vibrio quintilis TaxID=1117707 RepID=A0A1M7YS25_9VIBR|nr:5-histidylcysteine sulfoxide synthase [Vibrio quintilis]SHO55431.1 Iron(II)-dependent oxidoreductase EgtB [Vibrio quintilis]